MNMCLQELLILDSFLDEDRTNRFSFCLRRAHDCQPAGCNCSRSQRFCKEGFRPRPELEGWPDLYKCCWYVSYSRHNNSHSRDS